MATLVRSCKPLGFLCLPGREPPPPKKDSWIVVPLLGWLVLDDYRNIVATMSIHSISRSERISQEGFAGPLRSSGRYSSGPTVSGMNIPVYLCTNIIILCINTQKSSRKALACDWLARMNFAKSPLCEVQKSRKNFSVGPESGQPGSPGRGQSHQLTPSPARWTSDREPSSTGSTRITARITGQGPGSHQAMTGQTATGTKSATLPPASESFYRAPLTTSLGLVCVKNSPMAKCTMQGAQIAPGQGPARGPLCLTKYYYYNYLCYLEILVLLQTTA